MTNKILYISTEIRDENVLGKIAKDVESEGLSPFFAHSVLKELILEEPDEDKVDELIVEKITSMMQKSVKLLVIGAVSELTYFEIETAKAYKKPIEYKRMTSCNFCEGKTEQITVNSDNSESFICKMDENKDICIYIKTPGTEEEKYVIDTVYCPVCGAKCKSDSPAMDDNSSCKFCNNSGTGKTHVDEAIPGRKVNHWIVPKIDDAIFFGLAFHCDGFFKDLKELQLVPAVYCYECGGVLDK